MVSESWITESAISTEVKLDMVIDIDIPKKLIASACYDKQHVCAYLQPFSH